MIATFTEFKKDVLVEKLKDLENFNMTIVREPYFQNGAWNADVEIAIIKQKYKGGVIG